MRQKDLYVPRTAASSSSESAGLATTELLLASGLGEVSPCEDILRLYINCKATNKQTTNKNEQDRKEIRGTGPWLRRSIQSYLVLVHLDVPR